jgi:pimeloyl-ACP methyl ester carboxylesterase
MSFDTQSPGVSSWRFYVGSRFGQIHIHAAQPRSGRGDRPPLVCFHTSPLSGAEFKAFQMAMGRDRLVLCPDTPGFGGSDGPADVPTIPVYAGVMADVLDSLGYGARGQGPVHALGVHTGTLIGTELAGARPDLVGKLVLSSIALFSDAQRAEMKRRFGGPQPLLSDPDYVPKTYRESVLQGPKELPEERRLELFVERMRAGTKSWYGPEASLSYDPLPRLKTLPQPVLLLVVTDMLAQNTRDAANVVARPTVIDVEKETSAWPFDRNADLLAERVRGFLDAA